MEIEEKILACDDEMEKVVFAYSQALREAAKAEVAYKKHRAAVLYTIASEKTNEDTRDAIVMQRDNPNKISGADLYENYMMAKAKEKELDSQIRFWQSKKSGLQSIAKGLRAVSGLE